MRTSNRRNILRSSPRRKQAGQKPSACRDELRPAGACALSVAPHSGRAQLCDLGRPAGVWVSTTVAVGYDRLICAAAAGGGSAGAAAVLREPPPAANLENFGVDGLEFRLGFWIRDPENGTGLLRSEINKQIPQPLRAHKVEIPFPQRGAPSGCMHRAAASKAPRQHCIRRKKAGMCRQRRPCHRQVRRKADKGRNRVAGR